MQYKVTVPYTQNDIIAMGNEIKTSEDAFASIKTTIEKELKDKLPGTDYNTFLSNFSDLEKKIQTAEDYLNKIKEINQAEIDRKSFDITIKLDIEDTIKVIEDAYDKALETETEGRFRNK